jgi:tRNA pseudouridine38-40 synthase
LLGDFLPARFRRVSRTFLAKLHYDGTGFVGWQRQPAGRSVQTEFERVLERIFGSRTAAYAAGRTDAGVHAVGQGVSFAAPSSWTSQSLHRALNALLPSDCWVESVHPMPPGFHARKSAVSRQYRYHIGQDEAAASPFRRRFEWALRRPLSFELLQASAQAVLGLHDFKAFAAKGDKPHHRCRLMVSRWEQRSANRGVRYRVEGDRFLHHMVRMLVGTMVDIALERRPFTDMALLLERQDNGATSPPAPPHGLYFASVTYPPEIFDSVEEGSHGAATLG